MSSNARRYSKSKDDQKLLEEPKRRDRSRKPLVLCRVPGPGRGTVMRVPVVGELIYGLVEKYTLGQYPTMYIGQAWESVPCTVISIREKDVLVSLYIPEELDTQQGKPPSGPALMLTPRVDNNCEERENDDPYKTARQYPRR